MVDCQIDIHDWYPHKAALDGSVASADNLGPVNIRGVKDIYFAKKRVIDEENMLQPLGPRLYWLCAGLKPVSPR